MEVCGGGGSADGEREDAITGLVRGGAKVQRITTAVPNLATSVDCLFALQYLKIWRELKEFGVRRFSDSDVVELSRRLMDLAVGRNNSYLKFDR